MSGDLTVTPPPGASSSGDPSIDVPIQEADVLIAAAYTRITLAADAPVAVPFGGLSRAQKLMMRVTSGDVPVAAALTSAAGAGQIVSVDPLFISIADANPYTAITLTRVPGTLTTVDVFLGQVS